VSYIKPLSPEYDVVSDSEFIGKSFQRFAHDPVAHDPELKVGNSADGESNGFDHRWKIFNLDEATNEEKSEAAFLRVIFRRHQCEPIDTVVDAGDAIALSQGSMAQVLASSITDGYNPIADE
jgi:hypothetical protein